MTYSPMPSHYLPRCDSLKPATCTDAWELDGLRVKPELTGGQVLI
jgi:hypothetical protein